MQTLSSTPVPTLKTPIGRIHDGRRKRIALPERVWRSAVNVAAKRSSGGLVEDTEAGIFTGLLSAELVLPHSVWAAESAVYDPAAGSSFLVNAAGVGYVLLVAYFLFRVLGRRAKRFREQRVADSPSLFSSSALKDAQPPVIQQKKLTVLDGVIGVVQSGVFAVGLFFFTTKVDALLLSTPLPEQYTAHNIAVTVRTIIRGFCYLFTFVFGMNCLGLTGLTIKLLIDPDSVNNEPIVQLPEPKSKLPKISVISDPEEVARAFDQVSEKRSNRNVE